MSDTQDSGAGQQMASGEGSGPKTTRYSRSTYGNPTQKTGRPDGTGGTNAFGRGDDTDLDGSTPYRQGDSVNPTARTGRPDADMNAPQRSYERVKGDSMSGVTDVSAGRVIQSTTEN